MSNAPKATGFFQTIPGLITATAGLLSAATGAIVALNQTGVVDLKSLTASKPPEHVASQGPSSLTDGSRVGSPPAQPPQSVATQPREPAPQPVETKTATTSQSERATPVTGPQPAQPKTEPAPSTTVSTPNIADAERLKAIQEGAAASSKPSETTPKKAPDTSISKPAAPPTREPEPAPAPRETRVTDSKSEPSKHVGNVPAQQPEPEPKVVGTRTVETATPVVKAPPSPASGKEPAPRIDPRDRVADARPSSAADMPVEDGRGARVVRPPGEIVRPPDAQHGSKRVVGGDDRAARGSQVVRDAGGGGSRQLDLTGLTLTIPAGWVPEPVEAGPMAPVAALRIADPSGDGVVRITRVLGAKGRELEEKTIDRWLGLVSKAGGGPANRADAKIDRFQMGAIRVTTVDMAGTIKLSPRDAGAPDQRMVAAIIDHPAGPHLVTITGPARSMAKWDAAIDGFLRSAKAD